MVGDLKGMIMSYLFYPMNRELLRRLVPILISAVGIFFFKWDVSTFLLYFYVDSLFVLVFAFLKSRLAVQSSYIWKSPPYNPKAMPELPLQYGATSLFGLFWVVSFLTTYFTVGFYGANTSVVAWSLLLVASNHVYDFIIFRRNEIYKKVTTAFCVFASFKRVFIFFFAVIVSFQTDYQFAVHALLFSQLAFELYFWGYEKNERRKETLGIDTTGAS